MVENSHLLELYKQHGAAQEKYTYFLLAAAGAAIGFAIQKTEGLHLSWQLLTCGLAVLCWGLSFYCGCRNIGFVKAAIYANYNLLQLKQGSHPQQPDHPQAIQAAMSGVGSALDRHTNKAAFYYGWQFRLLILGAAFFIAWHIQRLAFAGYGLTIHSSRSRFAARLNSGVRQHNNDLKSRTRTPQGHSPRDSPTAAC